jgi:acyl dehydratase
MVASSQSPTEPYEGQTLKPRPFGITAELLSDYFAGLDIAPRPDVPLMIANTADAGGRLLFSQQRGHLWLRQEWEFHSQLREGVEYTVEGRVAAIYPRKERTILLTETVLRDPSGAAVSVQRHHQSFLLDASPTAEVKLREPSEKEGARAAAPAPSGQTLARRSHAITLEMCGQFFHGSKNYHSDREQSRELGFKDVVVGGRMTMGYLGELLETELGAAWAQTGRLLVKFTNVTWPGETVRAAAVVSGPLPDDPSRQGVIARVEKADGTVVIAAEGSFAG